MQDYLQIKPGNYWVYETYYLDLNYNGGPGGPFGGAVMYDSVYALTDTMINGRVFHQLSKPIDFGYDREVVLISDSLGYGIAPGKSVVFSQGDTNTIFQSTVYAQPAFSDDSSATLEFKRVRDRAVTTPAGTFNTITMGHIWTFYPYAKAQQPITRRSRYYSYAKGIGLVSEILPFYTSDPHYVERRLIRYHVE